jgi:hypothetical protein
MAHYICVKVVYEDNSGAVTISKYGNFTKTSKHIEVHYHFIHENVKKGNIEVVKIESENNIADMFTSLVFFSLQHNGQIASWSVYELCNLNNVIC